MDNYELRIVEGSGWNGANWVLGLFVPAHGIWPPTWMTIRSFKTEDEARDEAAKLVADIAHASPVLTERK
jgi:hypothetical protein